VKLEHGRPKIGFTHRREDQLSLNGHYDAVGDVKCMVDNQNVGGDPVSDRVCGS
jgi:hypothetical protein